MLSDESVLPVTKSIILDLGYKLPLSNLSKLQYYSINDVTQGPVGQGVTPGLENTGVNCIVHKGQYLWWSHGLIECHTKHFRRLHSEISTE